jgi:hypothetical protein
LEHGRGVQAVAVSSAIATQENFNEILEYTTEKSWKATSHPYGVQAHNRYLDYVANIPKVSSVETAIDKVRRKEDKELWEQIM